jgi:histidine phosphotransferase ChpT
MSVELRMAEHLCARLCHDLTGPIGAVNNGVEFMTEQGNPLQQEALNLISSSAREAVSRLQFYRQAYGKQNDFGEASLQEKKQVAAAYFNGSKVALDWPDEHTDAAGVSVSQKMARLILNLIILASRTLIRGGVVGVRVEHDAEGRRVITVRAAGDTIKDDTEATSILHGDRAIQLSPKTVQAYLMRALIEEMEVEIAVTQDASHYTLTAVRAAPEVM